MLILFHYIGHEFETNIFIHSGQIPLILDDFLRNLGQAFSATALFLLGLKMVGRVKTLKGKYEH